MNYDFQRNETKRSQAAKKAAKIELEKLGLGWRERRVFQSQSQSQSDLGAQKKKHRIFNGNSINK